MIILKKISSSFLLGLAVIGLAFGTQIVHKKNTADLYKFVRVSGSNNSLNPSDYEYHPTDECEIDIEEKNCSAEWLEPSAPNIGDNPTGTLDPTSLVKGNRIEN